MNTHALQERPAMAAPRLTATLSLILAVGVLIQGLTAGAFLQGARMWHFWHEALGNALALPPVISLVAALILRRRRPDSPPALASRIALPLLVMITIAAGHAGRVLLAVHIPTALAVIGIAVWQATGIARGGER